MSKLSGLANELYVLIKEKERLENEASEITKAAEIKKKELLDEMVKSNIAEFKDESIGKKFVIAGVENVKKTDDAELNPTGFMMAFRRHGINIFKYTVHPQTLKAAVLKEIVTEDAAGNRVMPKWAQKYVTVDTFYTVKIK